MEEETDMEDDPKAREDFLLVRHYSFAATQSLNEYFLNNPGLYFVMGNIFYGELRIMADPIFRRISAEASISSYLNGIDAFLEQKSNEPNVKGFIPITQEALDTLVESGIYGVKRGKPVFGIPGIQDGTEMLVYR